MKTESVSSIDAPQEGAPGQNGPQSTHEQIEQRAYELFEEEGCPEGRSLDHWLAAESQLATP